MGRSKSRPSRRETSTSTVINRRRRRKNLWLKQIKRLQRTTELLIPKLPFSRVVREILQNARANGRDAINITRDCLQALQEASEIYLTQFMEDAYCCTLHRNRVTLMPVDFYLCRRLRGLGDVVNH